MLVLSRKCQEEIVVSETVRITVLEIKGNRVKLGVAAPREIAVRRQEVPPPVWGSPVTAEVAQAVECV